MSVLLARHARTVDTGVRLSGRAEGTHLSPVGVGEARVLARAVARMSIDGIYSSPLERAIETAETIAAHCRLPLNVVPALTEVDFGTWTGRRFDELADLADWRLFNDDPSRASIPGGESLVAAADRGMTALHDVATRHQRGTIVIVTHGDLISLLLTRVLAMPVGAYRGIAIAPASLSWVIVDGAETFVAIVNHLPAEELRRLEGVLTRRAAS